uniref:Uncharacterized protein n=1 Tax=Lactuca sativa TaxID=4236 RepID=A0A9R1XDT8_LACSA|nr:hypothetical protein LSAT_V11C400194300 [Lactuca sativa]
MVQKRSLLAFFIHIYRFLTFFGHELSNYFASPIWFLNILPIGDIAERFHALCLKDSGVLYEDHYLQICIKAKWRNHQGRLVLLLGNKNTGPLDLVQALFFFLI